MRAGLRFQLLDTVGRTRHASKLFSENACLCLLCSALGPTKTNACTDQAAGLTDFGDDTGCSSSAPKLQDVFGEIQAWLNLPDNKKELLYVKMETFVGRSVSCYGAVRQLSQTLKLCSLQPLETCADSGKLVFWRRCQLVGFKTSAFGLSVPWCAVEP